MSSLQCLKRVHLEIHRKDLLEYSKATEAAFAIGHEVGDMAIRLYGRGRGSEIEYGKGNLSQAWVHQGVGYALDSISLAHIDNRFRYRGDGDYDGLLVENDLDDEVRNILPSVPAWVEKAKEAVDGPLPKTPVGAHCTKPYARRLEWI